VQTVLIVEDEPAIAMALEDALRLEGYGAEVASDGVSGLERALAHPPPDALVLDLRLPGLSGLDLLRRLRAAGGTQPVIVLTARGAEADRVAGLECGADDYVVKPFSMAELVARVRAHLRREREYRVAQGAGGQPETAGDGRGGAEAASFGEVRVDFTGHRLLRDGREEALSALECKLLRLLWLERGRTVSRDRFLREVWGFERMPVTRTVDFHMGRLRKKVEADPSSPRHIVTHHGVGYRLET
jgi:DNA-binding response OmpR family regulator